jgi:hypothetical protein
MVSAKEEQTSPPLALLAIVAEMQPIQLQLLGEPGQQKSIPLAQVAILP